MGRQAGVGVQLCLGVHFYLYTPHKPADPQLKMRGTNTTNPVHIFRFFLLKRNALIRLCFNGKRTALGMSLVSN